MAVKSVCAADDCCKPAIARGLCGTCWARWRKFGDPNVGKAYRLPATCEAPGCDRKPSGRWHGGPALCNKHYLRMFSHGTLTLPERSEKPWGTCTLEGCDKPARSRHGLYCDACYCRRWRNKKAGNGRVFEHVPPSEGFDHTGGYRLIPAKGHPLRDGKVGIYEYEHRVRFYDKHGAGPFNCHHCGKQVTWDDMHVDHLNDNPQDNDLNNLVASCPTCNQWRGKRKMKRTMRERHAIKITWRGTTKTLAEWAEQVGIDRVSLQWRLKRGWSLDRALTEPRGRTGPRRRHEAQGTAASV